MGASSQRERIESKMLQLKLRRVEIKQERKERIKELEKLIGEEVIREQIPDYIDHSEDEIPPEERGMGSDEENDNKEIIKKIVKKKNKKKEGEDKKYNKETENDDDQKKSKSKKKKK